MPERETWHVTPAQEGWQVKKQNNDQATSRHETKTDAVEEARDLARNRPRGGVRVHRRDGTVQRTMTYESDGAATA